MSISTTTRLDPRRTSPAINVLGAVGIAVLTNAVVFLAGWDSSADTDVEPSFAPPGWAIGTIWIGLFAAMGLARWLLTETGTKTLSAVRTVTALVVCCAAYPFYTAGLDNRYAALAGTVVTFLLAVIAVAQARRASPLASSLVALVAAWTVFAGAIIIRGIQLN